MRLPPKDVIATWPEPNYDDPDTKGPSLLVVQLCLMPLAMLALGARLYVRVFLMKKAGVDDWLMLGAMIFVIATTITVILASEVYGWKIHIWDLTEHHITNGRKASIAAQTLYLFASALAKVSILVAYLRIAPYDSWFRRSTIGAIPLVVTLAVSFLIVLWAQCTPVNAYWELQFSGKHCIDEGPPLIGQAITSVAMDVLVYVLPLPTLHSLSLPLRQRVVLLFVFGCGFIVVVAGSMRLYWVAEVVNNTYDVTWDGFTMWIWTAVEVNLGVICGCIPTLRPLFKYFQAGIRRASGGNNSNVIGEEMVRCRRRSTRQEAAPWFGDLNWLEGSNWLGSLGATNTNNVSPSESVGDLDRDDKPRGSHDSGGVTVVPVSTTESDLKGRQVSLAEIA